MKILQGFIPKTIENRAAFRTAVATLGSILIAFKLHAPMPFWAAMSVLFLTNMRTGTNQFLGSTINRSLLRVMGTVVGASIGYLIAAIVVNDVYMYLLMSFFVIAIATFFFNTKSYGYAFFPGGLAAFIVIAQLDIHPDAIFSVAVWRSIEISIGVIVAALCAYLVLPTSINEYVVKNIDVVFKLFSQEIEALQQVICKGLSSFDTVAKIHLQLNKELKKTTDMIGLMRYEIGVSRHHIDKIRALALLLKGLTSKLDYFIASQEDKQHALFSRDDKLLVDSIFNAIRHDLDQIKFSFFNNEHEKISLESTVILLQLDKTVKKNSEQPANESQFYYQTRQLLFQLNEILVSLSTLPSKQTNLLIPQIKIYSRYKRLQNDPDMIKLSIKAGLSAVLAMVLWLFSNWPGGINGIISSFVISLRKNIDEIESAGLHRVIGCLLGGGAALLFMTNYTLDLFALCVLTFFLVWAFSYITFKYPTYWYLGLQANVALVITMAQSGGPPMSLDRPLERLGGIFIGIGTTFIVANIVWRTDALTMLEGRLKKLFGLLRYNLDQVLNGERDKIVFHDVSNLFWVCRGLIESLSNKTLNPNKQMLLNKCKQCFEKYVLMQATASCIYDSINLADARQTSEKLGIPLMDNELRIQQLYIKENKDELDTVHQQLDECLTKVNRHLPDSQVSTEQITNLLAYIGALRQLVRYA